MAHVGAVSILVLTVGLSLRRPTVWGIHIDHAGAALIGALLALLTGIVPLEMLRFTVVQLAAPVTTIVSLMIITLVADRAGLLEILARRIAISARGDARRLFALIFACGTLVGTVFTNDAAVLILTPLVFTLIEEVKGPGWNSAAKMPFYFAVLYIANLVGALVISNPINIVVASMFGIGFIEYAAWMVLPAAVSIVVTFVGLRLYFGAVLPERCEAPRPARARDHQLVGQCAAVLAITLIGFFSEDLIGAPTWLVAAIGAAALLALYARRGGAVRPVIGAVGWDAICFLIGIFIVVLGLRNVGVAHLLGDIIISLAGDGLTQQTFATGLVAAISSALMNNHPTADLMTWVVQDFGLGEVETRMLALSALIGGDLGPKMLPIGSLAALMWFRLLRQRGVEVSYGLYIKLGVPISIAAILASIATLNAELAIYRWAS